MLYGTLFMYRLLSVFLKFFKPLCFGTVTFWQSIKIMMLLFYVRRSYYETLTVKWCYIMWRLRYVLLCFVAKSFLVIASTLPNLSIIIHAEATMYQLSPTMNTSLINSNKMDNTTNLPSAITIQCIKTANSLP